jgi:cobalt-zinc-cadmium efflux system outer membrane protein
MLSKSLSKLTLLFFTSVLLLFHSALHAEPQRINLQQAISKTFEHNPALRSFSYALKAQQGRQLQAGLTASPELSFMVEDALGTGDFKGLDNAQATLSIAWVIEGETRQGYIDVADAGASSLSSEVESKRLDAAAETARLYIVVLANQARLSYAVKTVELAIDTVFAVKKRVAAGKTPDAELARARAELYRRQLGHEDIEHEHHSAIRLLAAQWGETRPGFSQVDGDIFHLPATQPFSTLKTQLERSPEFTRLMLEKRLKQAQLKLAESKSDSPWRVDLGIRHFETSNDQALVAGISIPFGERSRNTGGIIEARENLSQTQAQADALKVRFETTLYVLSEELQHALHRVDAYRNDIIPQLEKALKETRRAYNLGRYSYLEWRTVQADLLDARSALIEASIDMHLKVIEIERLTGVSMTQAASKS